MGAADDDVDDGEMVDKLTPRDGRDMSDASSLYGLCTCLPSILSIFVEMPLQLVSRRVESEKRDRERERERKQT